MVVPASAAIASGSPLLIMVNAPAPSARPTTMPTTQGDQQHQRSHAEQRAEALAEPGEEMRELQLAALVQRAAADRESGDEHRPEQRR